MLLIRPSCSYTEKWSDKNTARAGTCGHKPNNQNATKTEVLGSRMNADSRAR